MEELFGRIPRTTQLVYELLREMNLSWHMNMHFEKVQTYGAEQESLQSQLALDLNTLSVMPNPALSMVDINMSCYGMSRIGVCVAFFSRIRAVKKHPMPEYHEVNFLNGHPVQ